MKHRFKTICPNADKLLKGVDKLGAFMSNVDKLSTDPAWSLGNWPYRQAYQHRRLSPTRQQSGRQRYGHRWIRC
jgi:hypothetical protein